jgi:nitronate monooxygenase
VRSAKLASRRRSGRSLSSSDALAVGADVTKLLQGLRTPIVQAPLSGGPSTPALAAAVAEAGGLGFLAAGYKATATVADNIRELRTLTDKPFGVNLFMPATPSDVGPALADYAAELQPEAARYDVQVGPARHDDDEFETKLELVYAERVGVVSFTFGCPSAEVVERVHGTSGEAWVTITSPAEALEAERVGADALVAQGLEAGGHRGYFVDSDDVEALGLLVLLRLVASASKLPLVAAGGIADGAAVAAVLAAGAAAAQIGTALMLTREAGTAEAHRAALRSPTRTALTRAFSGRQARSVVNRFMREHSATAPQAYPDVHHMTTPIRAAARAVGDPEAINLWAGQAHSLARESTAAEVIEQLTAEAKAALAASSGRFESR